MCTSPLYRIDFTQSLIRLKLGLLFDSERWFKRVRNKGIVINKADKDYLLDKNIGFDESSFQTIPCSSCLDCRINYSREWAVRIMLEAKNYENNYFVTLTYDDYHLDSLRRDILFPDGEFVENCPELVKSELQNFMKRLRSAVSYHYGDYNIRFYACGEYGSLNGRPHFHICLMNMPKLDDLTFFSKRDSVTLHTSHFIESCWLDSDKVLKGYCTVGEVTFQSAAYVARYIMKKQKGKSFKESNEALIQAGYIPIQPEFVLMSRNPGLARDYYENHRDEIYDIDKLVVKFGDSVKIMKPPKYFDYLYDIDEPVLFEQLKFSRRDLAMNSECRRSERTDLSVDEYNELRDRSLKKRVSKLVRNL